jgi:hypothetical protein
MAPVRTLPSRLGTGFGIAASKGDQRDQFIATSRHDDGCATRYSRCLSQQQINSSHVATCDTHGVHSHLPFVSR